MSSRFVARSELLKPARLIASVRKPVFVVIKSGVRPPKTLGQK